MIVRVGNHIRGGGGAVGGTGGGITHPPTLDITKTFESHEQLPQFSKQKEGPAHYGHLKRDYHCIATPLPAATSIDPASPYPPAPFLMQNNSKMVTTVSISEPGLGALCNDMTPVGHATHITGAQYKPKYRDTPHVNYEPMTSNTPMPQGSCKDGISVWTQSIFESSNCNSSDVNGRVAKRWKGSDTPQTSLHLGQMEPLPIPPAVSSPARMPLDGVIRQSESEWFPTVDEDGTEMDVDYARVNSSLKLLHLERIERRIRSISAAHQQRQDNAISQSPRNVLGHH
jgi:hypothetical protein